MTIETRLRVRYAETDQMGVVYYANYLVWMEVGRVEYCRAAGIRYRDLEQEGILLTVAKAECRYSAPAMYDDEVIIATTVAKAHPRLLAFRYEIRRAAGLKLLAEGETTHVFCDRALRPCRLPAKYWEVFGINGAKSSVTAASDGV
jgi:acyl-CoA thioester hydrolase